MGISESVLSQCVGDVLGSFDCTIKSKCLENVKCMNLYYHCRTTNSEMSDSEDEETLSF
jgi:hypothetical protein